ncbi:MAG: SH3 domain-containing protein [Pseudomonadota bacterium]
MNIKKLLAATVFLISIPLYVLAACYPNKEVNLRTLPSDKADSMATLQYDQKVEVIEFNNKGWVNIKFAGTTIGGWILENDLTCFDEPDLDKKRITNKKQLSENEKKRIEARKLFAKQYENTLLDKGLDFYATTEGEDNTTFKLKYALMTRPLAHQMSKETDFLSTLKSLGFRTAILTDGYNETWSIDLQ